MTGHSRITFTGTAGSRRSGVPACPDSVFWLPNTCETGGRNKTAFPGPCFRKPVYRFDALFPASMSTKRAGDKQLRSSPAPSCTVPVDHDFCYCIVMVTSLSASMVMTQFSRAPVPLSHPLVQIATFSTPKLTPCRDTILPAV